MKPRIKCIAAYPGMDCNVGDVFVLPSEHWKYADNGYCDLGFFSAWPALFQPLQWFEERDISELPDYVKYLDNSIMMPVKRVAKCTPTIFNGDGFDSSNFLPATKEEYEQYTAAQQSKP